MRLWESSIQKGDRRKRLGPKLKKMTLQLEFHWKEDLPATSNNNGEQRKNLARWGKGSSDLEWLTLSLIHQRLRWARTEKLAGHQVSSQWEMGLTSVRLRNHLWYLVKSIHFIHQYERQCLAQVHSIVYMDASTWFDSSSSRWSKSADSFSLITRGNDKRAVAKYLIMRFYFTLQIIEKLGFLVSLKCSTFLRNSCFPFSGCIPLIRIQFHCIHPCRHC